MRIAMISQWYDPGKGSAIMPGTIARALAARGNDVQVVTGFPNYPDVKPVPRGGGIACLAGVLAGLALVSARQFLGDVGSYLLGALIGIGIVIGSRQTPSVIVLLAPLAIYLADTVTTLSRRALRGEHLMTAHREHVYQRLVSEAGLSHSLVAGLTMILALTITLAWVPGSPALGIAVTLVVVGTYLASPVFLARTSQHRRRTTDSTAEAS